MIIGQLGFGLFGDALGRHKVYGKELMLTIFGTLMLIVAPTGLSHSGIVIWLAVFRIVTGFGIGGRDRGFTSLHIENYKKADQCHRLPNDILDLC